MGEGDVSPGFSKFGFSMIGLVLIFQRKRFWPPKRAIKRGPFKEKPLMGFSLKPLRKTKTLRVFLLQTHFSAGYFVTKLAFLRVILLQNFGVTAGFFVTKIF